jgi:hypothetical protein
MEGEYDSPSLGPGLLTGGVLIAWPAWAWQLLCPIALCLPFGSHSRAREHGVLVLQREGKIKGRVWGGTGGGSRRRENPLAVCAGRFQECVLGPQCQGSDPGAAARARLGLETFPGEGGGQARGGAAPPPPALC